MQLELGAGERPTPGYVHLDERPLPDIEYVGDATKLTTIVPPESCTTIRAAHLLEHFPHGETVSVLEEWHRALSQDGLLLLEVPNLEWQANAIANPVVRGTAGKVTEDIIEMIFGEQNYEGNYHKTGFTATVLAEKLALAGFEDVVVDDIGMVLLARGRKP